MRIKKLSIKNFKSLKELEMDDLRQLNVFIGQNDAGKSNIISALDILFNSNLQSHEGLLKAEKEDILETTFNKSFTYQLFDSSKPEIEVTAFLELNSYEITRLGLKSGEEKPELVISKKVVCEKERTTIKLDFIRLNKKIIIKTPDETKRFLSVDGRFTDKVEEFAGFKLLEELPNQFIMMPADRHLSRGSNLVAEKYLKESLINLANSKEQDKKLLFEQFTGFIKKISPLIEDVEVVTSNKKVTDVKFLDLEKRNIPLSTIGGGNNELLLLLHEIIISGGKILAIEEPEIHLHPEAQRKLYRLMQEFSQTTQMMIVTHSPVFVNPDNLRGLYRVVKYGLETRIHFMDENEYVDRNRLEQELNTENCEMFFADKVLLVEGISDKIFMEGLISKYCKSTKDIKVVSSYSKDNFEVYVKLLKIFDIPFIVMTDLDAVKGRLKARIVWNELKGRPLRDRDEIINFLKTKSIYVLSKGALESSYPRRYRRHISKPLDALHAIHNLTNEEYFSDRMSDLREIITVLEK